MLVVMEVVRKPRGGLIRLGDGTTVWYEAAVPSDVVEMFETMLRTEAEHDREAAKK